MTTEVQKSLPGLRVEFRQPVMSVDSARGMLALNEDEVLELCGGDLAELPWCFHIETPGAQRREIRILADCVRHYQVCLGSRPFPALGWSGVLGKLYPHSKPFITGVEFRHMMQCSSQLVLELILAKALRTVTGKCEWRPGPGGSPVLDRDSVTEFLKQRRMR